MSVGLTGLFIWPFFQKILGLQVFPPQSIDDIVIFQFGAGMQHGDEDDHEYPGNTVEDLFPREYEGKLKHIAEGIVHPYAD